MLAVVEVGVCLERPPRVDAIRRVVVHVDSDDLREAELLACQIASCGVEMPTASRVVDVLEI